MVRLWSVLVSVLLGVLSLPQPARSLGSFVTFESGQVRPLALSPDGTQLFATNTPDNRLEIFTVDPNGITHSGSVPVGMEPIAVAARTDSEVWVVNHLSDSISLVDVGSSPPRVVRTLLVGDEPRDIVFAGPHEGGDPNAPFTRAFITTAHRGQNSPLDPQLTTEGVGRADVWIFDATSLGSGLGGDPLDILTLFGDTPRALAATADGSTVYAAVFHSGNRTTALTEGLVCNGGVTAGPCEPPDGIVVPGGDPNGQVPGGLPAPNVNVEDTSGPEVGLIVRFEPNAGTFGEWQDELGRNWNNAVRFDLPDLDVFQIDAADPNVTGSWAGVGTILFNMAVNPVSGKIYVSNTEAPNEVRFEGPGILASDPNEGKQSADPPTVQGHLHEARITVLDPNNVNPRHLNKHINYSAVLAGDKAKSLATPLEMAVSSDGSTLYVAAFGSSKVGVFDTTALENDSFVPDSSDHIAVSGGGPTGVVLDEANERLYVLTRFDNSVAVIDLTSGAVGAEVDKVELFNAEPAKVVEGRPFLYDAAFTSFNGEASCSACHVFADFDSLAWDLGDPDGTVETNPNPFKDFGILPSNQDFHPMKGPMTTQTLRGMANHGPMHWRGDRTGLNVIPPNDPMNEELAFIAFNVAFPGLLGRQGQLDPNDMQAFTDFILEVTLPPNPIRNLNNALSTGTPSAQGGSDFYFGPVLSDTVANCNGCHVLDPSQGFFGTDGDSTFESETQEFKIPHLRNMYQKVGMFGMPTITLLFTGGDPNHQGPQVRGFGFLHDGSVDTLFRFHSATLFTFPGGDSQRRDVEAFMMEFDSTLAPIVGQQITLDDPNDSVAGARIELMIQRAMTSFDLVDQPGATECDLIVKGTVGGESRGWLMSDPNNFMSDKATDPALKDAELRALAGSGQELTYTCTPPGSGTRMGIDRDEDGLLDADDPNDTNSPGPDTGPIAVQSKDQQKCINELNKNGAKVAKAQGKNNISCVKDASKGKLIGTIADCLTSDPKAKVSKAEQKALDKEGLKCAVETPDYAATSATTQNQVMVEKEMVLIEEIFGSDLETAVVTGDAGKCQEQVHKQAQKCQDTKLKEFNKCKKDGLKGKAAPPGADLPFDNAADIELCMGHDPKAKITKACDTKLLDKINKKCVGNLDVFAGCGTPASVAELRVCIDRIVECQVCLALNQVDDLARDCDDFDDGVTNGSCP